MSDERTIRDDLVIRENSSPDARRGIVIVEKSALKYRGGFLDATDNEDELRIIETIYEQAGGYKVSPHVGRAPIFLQSLTPIISKAGDIVTLKCTVTATPMPSAVW